MPVSTWTDDDNLELQRLFDEGLGRNAIAKAMGTSYGTVTNKAKALGLSFDRSIAKAATEAARADAALKRSELAAESYGIAALMGDKFFETKTIWVDVETDSGNIAKQPRQTALDPRDYKDLAQARSYLIRQALDLDKHDVAKGQIVQAGNLIDSFMASLDGGSDDTATVTTESEAESSDQGS